MILSSALRRQLVADVGARALGRRLLSIRPLPTATPAAAAAATRCPARVCSSASPTNDGPAQASASPSPHTPASEARAYDLRAHLAEAEGLLREVYGPRAKLVVTRTPAHRGGGGGVGGRGAARPDAPGGDEDNDVEVEETVATPDGPPAPSTRATTTITTTRQLFKVSATFRLLGFPVELAVTKGWSAAATVENCLRQALSSDVEFIPPAGGARRSTAGGATWDATPGLRPHQSELKAVMDELKLLCVELARGVRFSLKPPRAVLHRGPATDLPDEARLWRCRAYMRAEWDAVSRMVFALEANGGSPREALTHAVDALRARLRAELASPPVMHEGVDELAALVRPAGRTVTVACDGEETTARPSAVAQHVLSPDTYRAVLTVEDVHGNRRVVHARRQPSPLLACQQAAWSGVRAERAAAPEAVRGDARLPATPLLVRMRWQFDATVRWVAQRTGQPDPRTVARVEVGDVAGSLHHQSPRSVSTASTAGTLLPMFFTAAVYAEDALVWEATGAGRYRVEFDAYVQGLHYLLERYPEAAVAVAAGRASASGGGGGLFATAAQLAEAVDRHDGFDIVGLHRGRWSCYAVLGTLTTQLMGQPFQTRYHYVAPTPRPAGPAEDGGDGPDTRGEWRARLTVSDGRADPARPLMERGSLAKGEAWRLACLHALRENFPRAYAAALRHRPDLDLSADTLATGVRYRALPREKRVAHMGNLFSLIAAFAEEDMGWRQPRIRLRNASGDLGLPQWVAELEALVDEDAAGAASTSMAGPDTGSQRRVVATSAPYSQVRHARRALLYQVAQQYFPAELAVYKTLDRGDATDPDADPAARRLQLYQPAGPPFVQQLCHLMSAKHPSLAPVTWRLWARPTARTEEQDPLADVLDADEAARPASRAPLVLLDADLFPEHQLEALRDQLVYSAEVRGGGAGDVLLAEVHGVPGDAAVAVLTAALKSASARLAGADGETLWAEFETAAVPAASTSRELALALFQAFLGGGQQPQPQPQTDHHSSTHNDPSHQSMRMGSARPAGEVIAGGRTADLLPLDGHAVRVRAVEVGHDYWFATVTLPRLGELPIARAVGSARRQAGKDALLLAARSSFPRALQHYARHDPALAALATDVLTEPVVERLPDSAVRALREKLSAGAGAGREAGASASHLSPLKLLMACVRRERADSVGPRETALVGLSGETVLAPRKQLVVRQTQSDGGSTHECRLYLQSRRREVRRGDAQLVGLGSGMSAARAVTVAALMALENLYPEDLARAEEASGGEYRVRWLSDRGGKV